MQNYFRILITFNFGPFSLFWLISPQVIKSNLSIRSSKEPDGFFMHHHVKVWSCFWLLPFSSLIADFPGLFLEIKGIHIGHVSCFFRDIATIDKHLVFKDNCWVRVYFGNSNIWLDFLPFLAFNAIGKDQITWIYGRILASEEVNSVLVDDCSVWFQFNWLAFV